MHIGLTLARATGNPTSHLPVKQADLLEKSSGFIEDAAQAELFFSSGFRKPGIGILIHLDDGLLHASLFRCP